MHKIVPNSVGPLRQFSITVGLREGYEATAKTHPPETVRDAALAWMAEHADREEQFLTGTLTLGDVCYAYPLDAGGSNRCHEPAAIFSGLVNTLYNLNLTDDQVKALLNGLGEALAYATNQTRVYVVYRDETWILQREGTVTPRGREHRGHRGVHGRTECFLQSTPVESTRALVLRILLWRTSASADTAPLPCWRTS